MANVSVSEQLRSSIESFVADLSDLLRQSAMEMVQNALAGLDSPRPGTRANRGAASPRVARGGKRSPAELEAITNQFLAYVQSNPGERIEHIAKSMGTSTKELNLSVKKLLNSKAIKRSGQKRATQYFPR